MYIISSRYKDIYRNVLLFLFFFDFPPARFPLLPFPSIIKCDLSIAILRAKRWPDKIEAIFDPFFEGGKKITVTFFLIIYPLGYKNLLLNRIQVALHRSFYHLNLNILV